MAPRAPTGSPRLDVLRSFAVLTVLFGHVWFENPAFAAAGRVGVLFFFLHTSLVLMFSLARQQHLSGNRRLFSAFMLRRTLRIYPLSMLVVMAVFVFAIPAYVLPNGDVYQFDVDALGLAVNLLLVQDIVVSNGGSHLLGVLWTLPIELQMYLTLPLVFLFVRRVSDLRVLLPIWIVTVIGALGAPGFLFHITNGQPVAAFAWGWLTFPRILEFVPHFLAGVIAFVVWQRVKPRIPFVALPILMVAVLLGYFGIASGIGRGHLLNAYGMLACLAVAVVLPSIREPSSDIIRWAAGRIARYSYGIYLVHVSCLWLGFQVFDSAPGVVQWGVFLCSTLAVSATLYHVIERPVIRLGANWGRAWTGTGGVVAEPAATALPAGNVSSGTVRGGR